MRLITRGLGSHLLSTRGFGISGTVTNTTTVCITAIALPAVQTVYSEALVIQTVYSVSSVVNTVMSSVFIGPDTIKSKAAVKPITVRAVCQ